MHFDENAANIFRDFITQEKSPVEGRGMSMEPHGRATPNWSPFFAVSICIT
jgi:hypothetical protein